MPNWTAILLVVLIVGCDLMVFAMIRSVIFQMFRRWQEKYPPIEPGPDAVTRRFQTFSFGLMNAGWSIHVTVDEASLHLTPTRFLRFFGVQQISVPWEAFGAVKSRGKIYTKVMLDKTLITGPTWCLSLLDAGDVRTADAEEPETAN